MKERLNYFLKDTAPQPTWNFVIKKKSLIERLFSQWDSEGNFTTINKIVLYSNFTVLFPG